jgi:hypothetical protein
MKTTEFVVENSTIAQEADDMHRDHEVQMARSQMYSAAQAAIEIHRLLKDISEIEGLEGWVQSKLTLASQYLESVRDYMKYEAVSQESELMPFAESAAEYALESLLREQTTVGPGGMSRTTGPGGDITTRSDIGGTSVSQTKTPGGFTKQTTANMDMGNAGSASMVKQAPQQPGQLAGTTTVTRTAAPTVPGQGSATAATGSATQGVAFGGASGKNVGQNVVTTGDAGLAQQAKGIMPASNTNLEEEDFERGDIDDAIRQYMRSGGEVKQGKPAKGPRRPGMSMASKHIGGGGDKMKPSRTGRGSNPVGKAVVATESATGGASSAGGVATSMGGAAHKPTSGVPKKVGNSYKPKKVSVGKGVY